MAYVFTTKQKRSTVFFSFLVLFLMLSLILFIKNREAFQGRNYYNLVVPNSRGIEKGNDVIMNDIVIGKVVDLKLVDSNNKNDLVNVEFFLYDNYSNSLREDTDVFIQLLLDGSKLFLYPVAGSSSPLIKENGKIVIDDFYNLNTHSIIQASGDLLSVNLLSLNLDILLQSLLNKDDGIKDISENILELTSLLASSDFEKFYTVFNDDTKEDFVNIISYSHGLYLNLNKSYSDLLDIGQLYDQKNRRIKKIRKNINTIDYQSKYFIDMVKEYNKYIDILTNSIKD